jgi:hypothetical protein
MNNNLSHQSVIDDLSVLASHQYNIAFDLLARIHGELVEVYYPKVIGQYSGKFDDTTYSNTPDKYLKLLVPDIYELKSTPIGGVNDNLFSESYKVFTRNDELLPLNTKLIINSSTLGPLSFIVDKDNSVVAKDSIVVREYEIYPYLSYNTTTIKTTDYARLSEDYELVKTSEYTDDNSIASSSNIVNDHGVSTSNGGGLLVATNPDLEPKNNTEVVNKFKFSPVR